MYIDDVFLKITHILMDNYFNLSLITDQTKLQLHPTFSLTLVERN